jgi:hypothetical protein
MHHGLIKTLRGIVEEAGVPKASIVEEARGLRQDDRTRPGDLAVIDLAKGERHLILDGLVTTVYRNTILANKGGGHSRICSQASGRQEV